MALVYQYLAGQGFQQRISGMVDAFGSLQTDLEKEKRSMNAIWKKRGKQLERAMQNASGMFGDLQGIIGASMPTIPELSLKLIGDTNDEPAKNPLSA